VGESVIDVSIVVPTKNEQISVGQFIEWCHQGFKKEGVNGEILLMDCSTDETRQIAERLGARVITVEEPGLGAAYDFAKPFIRGEIVVMGDADCTYDFRDISALLAAVRAGADFVMGSRFKGSIEPGAMPPHHQYFGSPATTWVFRQVLGIKVSDIHCGIRALTKELYCELPFLERGWLYASEMIISARNLGANIAEVPVPFLKEPEGRLSHHVRGGWLSPFKAGWGTLRVIATYGFPPFLIYPGLLVAFLSFFASIIISLLPAQSSGALIGPSGQSLLAACSMVGVSLFGIGAMASAQFDLSNKALAQWLRFLKISSAFPIAVCLTASVFVFGLLNIYAISVQDHPFTEKWTLLFALWYASVIWSTVSAFLDYLARKRQIFRPATKVVSK
jgi:glycosyltransferase involved in cell wall biosynthesis